MKRPNSYKAAGVNIDAADNLVTHIKRLTKVLPKKGVIGDIGGFSGLFDIPKEIRSPLLVATTDGVGTKLKLAHAQRRHDTIGIDLVAMCVNDLITCGATPLFFLDYYAMGKLNTRISAAILKGIVDGCKQSNCALLGGETAEMPGLYHGEDYDLAGFAVGAVDRKKVLDGKNVKAGDVMIGLHSSGVHSNGFSLVRKLFTEKELASAWGKQLLVPTLIYVKPILALVKAGLLKASAHITGGGFYDNIPRCLPANKKVVVKKGSWEIPSLFTEMQRRGKISDHEMFRTFNMGIGMALVVEKNNVAKVQKILKQQKCAHSVIGHIENGKSSVTITH